MTRYLSYVVLLCMLGSTLAFGQFRGNTPSGDTGNYLRGYQSSGLGGLRGILDPTRMKMSHSFSMGYVSAGGQSASQGMYMNRLDYQISQKLSATTHLGYQFQPSGPAEWNPATNGNSFVGGADLNYSPTRNSLFRLSVYKNMDPYRSYGPLGWNQYSSSADYFRP